MLIFQGFSSSHIVCDIPAFSFKVLIATPTRNRLIRKGPWVRIPPSPPKRLSIFVDSLFYISIEVDSNV